ncbi:hypothetical protein K493DRAFT_349952 [Basidiobolus meristosporus CBS 931.73]|uniref:PX domain-containing protein n=1 Tax=Basidiobolus meristosporus CBS 931.73 TaxID=1314790 RepID=A0A1Y1YI25_9FUNG|nr:hypothetical protein K493DRAFT_349952 [Basidiobolus meristosporus CBS 931.73]|eukprot:ORX97629.1 hypothetical protein K493DRAFT_349952 [Basidiobolus meristosporus CBS 931.73]
MSTLVTKIDTGVVKLAPLISAANVGTFDKRPDKKRWFTVTVIPADFNREGDAKKPYSIYRTQEHFVQLSTKLHEIFASQQIDIPELQLPQRTFLLLVPSGAKIRGKLNAYIKSLFQYPIYVAASSAVLEFFGVWKSDVEYVREHLGSEYPDFYGDDDYNRADSAVDLDEKADLELVPKEQSMPASPKSPTVKIQASPKPTQQPLLRKKTSFQHPSLMQKYKPLTRSGTLNSPNLMPSSRPNLRRSKSAMLTRKGSEAPWNRVKRGDMDPVELENRPAIVAPWNLHYIEPQKVRDLLPSLPAPSSPYSGSNTVSGSPVNLSRSNTLRRAGTISRMDSCRSTRTLRKSTSTNSLSAAARREVEPITFLKVKVVLDEDTIVILRIHRTISFEDLLSDSKAFLVTGEKELNSALAHGFDRVTLYMTQQAVHEDVLHPFSTHSYQHEYKRTIVNFLTVRPRGVLVVWRSASTSNL